MPSEVEFAGFRVRRLAYTETLVRGGLSDALSWNAGQRLSPEVLAAILKKLSGLRRRNDPPAHEILVGLYEALWAQDRKDLEAILDAMARRALLGDSPDE